MMNKYKFLILIIIGLIISNGILFFMLFNKPGAPGGDPKNYIIEKLHFDKAQIKVYDTYIQQHRHAIITNADTMNKLRNNLYQQLKYTQDTAKIDSLISVIAKQQYKAEHINYNHFLEIKNMCDSSQQRNFEELVQEIAYLFNSRERK